MSFDKLKPELWAHVLFFLTPSLPKPLAGRTRGEAIGEGALVLSQLPEDGAVGTVGRRDIRAGELAVLMRTSIGFNNHAARILYRRIITDDFPSLLRFRAQKRAHPLIQSKAENLRHTQFLHLEYLRKGDESTYRSLMHHPCHFYSVGNDRNGDESLMEIVLMQGMDEVRDISDCLLPFRESPYQSCPFPRLRHVTIGAIFGGHDWFWGIIVPPPIDHTESTKEWNPVHHLIANSRDAIVTLFAATPITHWCQRGVSGPLALPPTVVWIDEAHGCASASMPSFTIHLDVSAGAINRNPAIIQPIPAVVGHITRWVGENVGFMEPYNPILSFILSSIKVTQQYREFWGDLIESLCPSYIARSRFDLDIWPSSQTSVGEGRMTYTSEGATYTQSTNTRNEPDVERQYTSDFVRESVLELEEPVKVGKKTCRDKITWKAAVDSPDCEGCGWKFERV